MSKKLQGQVAVVTGASKGIGAAIAEYLAAAGAAVVINYASSKTGADAVVNRIRQADGKVVAVQADVSKPEYICRLFAETKKAFAKLDILVNNAGIYEFAPLEAINAEHFYKQINLNVLAPHRSIAGRPPAPKGEESATRTRLSRTSEHIDRVSTSSSYCQRR